MKSICIKHIGVNTRYAGYIEYDNQFWQNLNLLQSSPMFIVSPATKNDAGKIVTNIMNGGQLKIDSIKNV
jgi:hypothetical protein